MCILCICKRMVACLNFICSWHMCTKCNSVSVECYIVNVSCSLLSPFVRCNLFLPFIFSYSYSKVIYLFLQGLVPNHGI